MNKNVTYTDIMLTLIVLLQGFLLWILVGMKQVSSSSGSSASELNVNIQSIGGRIVSTTELPVKIQNTELPVKVQNTVDVDVKGLNGSTMKSSYSSAGAGASGFPVVVLNQ